MTKNRVKFLLLLVPLALILAACSNSGPSAAEKAQQASDNLQKQIYQSQHNVEFRNYNLRQKKADDPSEILWCTFFPPGIQGVSNGSTPGQAITVPIAGKLTSSNKRPYAGTTTADNNGPGIEVPGPDYMYGSSAEYRYGFDPTLTTYYEFTNLASFCTDAPTVWQTQSTQIVVQTQQTLVNLSEAASAAIKAGDPKKALALLKRAEAAQGKVGK